MDTVIVSRGREVFRHLLAIGKRRTSPLERVLVGDRTILGLNALLARAPAQGESPGVPEDVPVARIVGTEGRSGDFAEGFYPRRDWMENRWVAIYDLMHAGGIAEPVQLIEYGGCYFVRDGNHRVSVAHHTGIEFLRAQVVHYRVPVSLPCCPGWRNLDLFTEKYDFNRRTGILDIIPEDTFRVNAAGTWRKLEKEILVDSWSWFVRNDQPPKDLAEHLSNWVPFYRTVEEHIRQRNLMLLFPGLLETDIFGELVGYWNSYANPDSLWAGEVYERFERRIRRRRLPLALVQSARLASRMATEPVEKQRAFFIAATRIDVLVPGFSAPYAGKDFFNLCYRQIYRTSARLWMEQEHSQPCVDEITDRWYRTYYSPLVERYRDRLYPVPFSRFYKDFSRRYYERVMGGSMQVTDALDEFERRLEKRRGRNLRDAPGSR